MPGAGEGRLRRGGITVPSTIRRADLPRDPPGYGSAHLDSHGAEASSGVVRHAQVVNARDHVGCRVVLGSQAPPPDAVAPVSDGPEPDRARPHIRGHGDARVREGPDPGADVAVPI